MVRSPVAGLNRMMARHAEEAQGWVLGRSVVVVEEEEEEGAEQDDVGEEEGDTTEDDEEVEAELRGMGVMERR